MNWTKLSYQYYDDGAFIWVHELQIYLVFWQQTNNCKWLIDALVAYIVTWPKCIGDIMAEVCCLFDFNHFVLLTYFGVFILFVCIILNLKSENVWNVQCNSFVFKVSIIWIWLDLVVQDNHSFVGSVQWLYKYYGPI